MYIDVDIFKIASYMVIKLNKNFLIGFVIFQHKGNLEYFLEEKNDIWEWWESRTNGGLNPVPTKQSK